MLPDASRRQAASEALWSCVGPADTGRLREAVTRPDPGVRIAAIPALELAAGADSLANILHEMTIDVQCLDDGDVRFDVSISDGAKSGERYSHTLTAKGEDIGVLNRIGLERSGRTGGAALFGALTVDSGAAKDE